MSMKTADKIEKIRKQVNEHKLINWWKRTQERRMGENWRKR